MSDNCLHIVPVHTADYPDVVAKAREILEWFIARDLVEAQASDCVLGPGPGYRFRPAIETMFEPSSTGTWFHGELATFGLEIHAGERRVFHPMEGAELAMTCRACGRVHGFEEATGFIPGWFDGSDEEPACLGCGYRQHLAEWPVLPDWAFSNLGVTLWNCHWAPKATFLAQIRELLGTDIRLVQVRL